MPNTRLCKPCKHRCQYTEIRQDTLYIFIVNLESYNTFLHFSPKLYRTQLQSTDQSERENAKEKVAWVTKCRPCALLVPYKGPFINYVVKRDRQTVKKPRFLTIFTKQRRQKWETDCQKIAIFDDVVYGWSLISKNNKTYKLQNDM